MMTIDRILIVTLIFSFNIHHAVLQCIPMKSLNLNTKYEPVIFNYSGWNVEFIYPNLDSRCVFNLIEPHYFGCLQNNVTITYTNDRKKKIFVCGNSSYSKAIHDFIGFDHDSGTRLMNGCEVEITDKSNIQCSDEISPTIKHIKGGLYFIGYEVNLADFLVTYKITFKPSLTLQAKATIKSFIDRRQINEDMIEFKKGSIYENLYVNFSRIYSMRHQYDVFVKRLGETSAANYFSEGNYLVQAQLISKDDLYYSSQQKSTFFHENTVPIWQSINDGNWKLIGDIVRKIAVESNRDMDIFVTPEGTLQIGESYNITLDDSENNSIINIPRVIVKIAVDHSAPFARGVVFHTFNDPYITAQEAEKIMLTGENKLCSKLLNCSRKYPTFLDASKGLTYCCNLGDSIIFSRELGLIIE